MFCTHRVIVPQKPVLPSERRTVFLAAVRLSYTYCPFNVGFKRRAIDPRSYLAYPAELTPFRLSKRIARRNRIASHRISTNYRGTRSLNHWRDNVNRIGSLFAMRYVRTRDNNESRSESRATRAVDLDGRAVSTSANFASCLRHTGVSRPRGEDGRAVFPSRANSVDVESSDDRECVRNHLVPSSL